MKTDMKAMDTKFEKSFDELKQGVHALEDEVNGMKDKVMELRKMNRELNVKLEDCEKRIDDLEGHSKGKNLIFYGLARRENKTSEECKGMLQYLLIDKLNIFGEMEFNRVHQLNLRPDSPVITQCTLYRLKGHPKKKAKKKKKRATFSEELTQTDCKSVRKFRSESSQHQNMERQKQKGSKGSYKPAGKPGKGWTKQK